MTCVRDGASLRLLRLARKGKLSTAPLDPACAKGVGEAHKL